MENKCSTHEECGASNDQKCCGHGEQEIKKGSCCLVEHAVEMWTCAGHRAWKEVHVDILKAKIMKAWGPQMEKTADAVVEAMGIEWKATLSQGKAKADLKQTIAAIFVESKK
jgi:hypothetical protein